MPAEHDEFRREAYERGDLIRELRSQGAVDLEVTRGAGFAAPERVIRKAHTGGGSGTYIGGPVEDWYFDRAGRRR